MDSLISSTNVHSPPDINTNNNIEPRSVSLGLVSNSNSSNSTTTQTTTATTTVASSSIGSINGSDDSNSNSDKNREEEVAEVVEEGGSPRRSGRERVSTCIYVGGQVVKKENNYVLKGGTYIYGGAKGEEHPPQRRARPVNNKSAAGAVPAKPREVSALEKQRAQLRTTIAANIAAKQTNRKQFLHEHVQTMKPFLDSKVFDRIQAYPRGNSVSGPSFLQPEAIKADMRAYQLEGMNWMAKMHSKNLGFILGDEMGLGKTLQTISLVCHLKEEHGATGPSLVVCPLSVLYSWCNEIKKWAPSLKFLRLHLSNTGKMQLPPNIGDYDMIVTTYEMCKVQDLRNMLWRRQHFNLVVLDEGHKIKNLNSQVSQAVRGIHAETRIILSGTPLANDLSELYALLNFLVPDVFTDVEPFAAAYDLTNNIVDRVKLNQANKVLDLFMIRRYKSMVEKKMPKKIETKVICPLSNTQIWLYKAFLLKDLNLIAGDKKSSPGALNNLIMQLRKTVNHPCVFPFAERNYDEATIEELVGDSGKLSVLDLLLQSLYKKGHRVCIFSQFTRTLDVLDDYCQMRGWSYCRFDGGTARAKRNYVVNSFNAPNSEKFLFLMSTRAGGMGLNLQTADTVILFDSDWNPQADIQAEARVHRIGQTKTVFVYRMVTANTVEERIAERAEKKLYLDRMVMGNDSSAMELENEDENPIPDEGRLMSALKFGCSAIFGNKAQTEMKLPTDEEIEMLTDRTRTEDYSGGGIAGGNEANTEDFDVNKEFTSTTDFGGIDFKKLREDYKKRRPKDSGSISNMLAKRVVKNRIMLVEGKGTGYGAAVPVLKSNDYDLQSGERSVFQRELGGRGGNFGNVGRTNLKGGIDFDWQEICQVCGDGGELVCCPRCPIAVHLKCAGMRSVKEFQCCSHHHCVKCRKGTTEAGGWMFRCSCCPSAYCEDHLPAGARILEECERIEDLGYTIKHGTFVHCSPICENVAIQDFGWVAPDKRKKAPCPPPIDVSSFFGGEIDECVEQPENLILSTKRKRKETHYGGEPTRPHFKDQGVASNPVASPVKKATDLVDLTGSDDEKPAPSRYSAILPVTPQGFQIRIAEFHGHSVFLGYSKNMDGTMCLAEKQGVFRDVNDRIIGINGGGPQSYEDTVGLLKMCKSRGDKFVTLSVDSDLSAMATPAVFVGVAK